MLQLKLESQIIINKEVANIAQQKSGICIIDILGTRILIIVVKKLIPPRIEDVPSNSRVIIQIPSPTLPVSKLNGGYDVQPAWAGPKKKLRIRSNPVGGIIQNATAFNLGNAISLAPIIRGKEIISKCTRSGRYDP